MNEFTELRVDTAVIGGRRGGPPGESCEVRSRASSCFSRRFATFAAHAPAMRARTRHLELYVSCRG